MLTGCYSASSDSLFLSLQEAEVVTSMSFHPTGDFILVGTEHPTSELLHDNFFRLNGLSYWGGGGLNKVVLSNSQDFTVFSFLPLCCFICSFIYFFCSSSLRYQHWPVFCARKPSGVSHRTYQYGEY